MNAQRPADAERALRGYDAMRRRLRMSSGLYRRDGWLHMPRTPAHLWPFSQAVHATLAVAGIGDGLTPGFAAEAEIADDLAALERYWEAQGAPPAYSSDVIGSRTGGDRYYDDNAWVGLALIQLELLRPGSGPLDRAEAAYAFAVSGWDGRSGGGGVFWVEQGRGVGMRNHDRNLVSTAPNAQLGLHLAALGRGQAGATAPEEMYAWVLATLDESRDGDEPGTGLFWDKIRGDGSIDRMQWSYNQGTMVGLNVLLARAPGAPAADYLGRAEAIARKALGRLEGEPLERQPPAFNAIFFRNLLRLHAATADARLREEIVAALRRYSERAWSRGLGREGSRRRSLERASLLDQSAVVQLLALLAWDPTSYARLV